ncbi:hypothetical protein [Actinomadura latina]|uniref:Uncharacterized protein n=1 Tax=Actinomadura latina TaxID=163603 RepID=A0A846Z0T5_9ACTN|nr:hypothetical protein [Actinomadura latina]NKZ04003.1 hypothetical protein [Actinomadura latina]
MRVQASAMADVRGDAQPALFEIFRIEDGRFAEMWGASAGFPASASPEDVVG